LLLWILKSLTPSEIRSKILKHDSDFCKDLVQYLESAHKGEFMTGTQDDVLSHADSNTPNPIETLPTAPPACICINNAHHADCKYPEWQHNYSHTVDDIISKSNIHTCTSNINKDGSKNKRRQYKGCMDNPWGKCRARFPRTVHETTKIDFDTGTIHMKKLEPWINTFTP
ncbi:hypothetical protein BDN72DRAFT_738552, partial [Pluteus cervinus]